jgi:hypothetical protein
MYEGSKAMRMRRTKMIVAAVGTVATVLTSALADDVLNASETATLIATVIEGAATVWAVWRVPNKPVDA